MLRSSLLFFCLAMSLLSSCGGEVSSSQSPDAGTDSTAVDMPSDAQNTSPVDLPLSHDCTISNDLLEGNQFWSRQSSILVAITADESTFDDNYGESHRVLEVYDTKTCEQLQREVLPVNVSPDFPYYIAEITFNKSSELVGIRGARTIYIYDIANRRLLDPLEPQYLSKRVSEDAQSGNILRLEVWENFLIGFAEDEGTFAFDLNNADTPEPVMPIAEFPLSETEFVPLFAFPSAEGSVQLALPDYDQMNDVFSINALYPTPQQINTAVQASARNNRYIVLRRNTPERTAIAIDMRERQLIDLPTDVAGQPTQAVLQWIRQR